MLLDLVEMHHVRVFMIQIEETHLVREKTPVEATLLDDDRVKSVRVGIDDAGANAAARALAADDQAIRSHLGEVSHQRRAEETARPLLVNDEIAGFGLKIF